MADGHNLDPNAVELGDIVQYVWGMPGPDYDEGEVIAIHGDGSFDVQLPPESYGGGITYRNKRLDDRAARVTIGSVRKVTRPGVNGF